MRVAVAAIGGVAVGLALAVVVAGPAAAKGPVSVTIALPGEEPVELAGSRQGTAERPDAVLVADLAEDLGVWETTGDGRALVAEAPTRGLGVALTVEWTMYNPVPDNPDAAPRVVQTLYPHAAGGALVHTEGGQRYFGTEKTRPGWYRAPERLVTTLEALGVESAVRLPAPAPAASPVPGDATVRPAADGSSAVPALATMVGLAVVGGLAVAGALGRSRRTGATATTTSTAATRPATSAAG